MKTIGTRTQNVQEQHARTPQIMRILSLWLGAILLLPSLGFGGTEALTLRINDTSAEPGAEVAVVLRTYASRPIRQGQLCLHASSPGRQRGELGSPLAQLDRVVVFSPNGDAVTQSSFNGPEQAIEVEFSSASASINSVDGPVVALYFHLDSSLVPGEEFTLDLDPTQTFLIDSQGQPVPIEIRAGDLTIKAAGKPQELGVEGTEVPSGSVARVDLETEDLFAIGAGEVTLEYDPTVVAGPLTVTMDERFGSAEFQIVEDLPGLLTVSFTSPDGSLNSLPGAFLSFFLPTVVGIPDGVLSAVSLDPASTSLWDPAGVPIALELSGGTLVFTDGFFFDDDFESGTLEEWGLVRP